MIAAGERLRESPRVDRLLTAGGEEDVGARHHVRREAGAWLAVKVVEARLIPQRSRVEAWLIPQRVASLLAQVLFQLIAMAIPFIMKSGDD